MLMTMMENKVVTPIHHKPTKSKNRYPPPQVTVLPSQGGFIREGDITDVSILFAIAILSYVGRRRRRRSSLTYGMYHNLYIFLYLHLYNHRMMYYQDEVAV